MSRSTTAGCRATRIPHQHRSSKLCYCARTAIRQPNQIHYRPHPIRHNLVVNVRACGQSISHLTPRSICWRCRGSIPRLHDDDQSGVGGIRDTALSVNVEGVSGSELKLASPNSSDLTVTDHRIWATCSKGQNQFPGQRGVMCPQFHSWPGPSFGVSSGTAHSRLMESLPPTVTLFVDTCKRSASPLAAASPVAETLGLSHVGST